MQRAKELALSGRIVAGDEALRIGLATAVVEPDQLRQAATEMAESFLAGAPKAQMFAKQALNASFEMSLADAVSWEGQSQSILLGTEDAAEGIVSFIEKRDPDWKGR
jgi:2-(1,2-epoxy-1,2-dihydrophenyl)acetyl-CoA isomerase